MLLPSVKVVFEGSSKEYYSRLKAISSSGMTGCARLVFSDFEGTIFYKAGKAITALQESGMWMALGEELIAPLENKATVTSGTLAVYELTPAMIALFEDRKISTTIETDLGKEINARMLAGSLGDNHSTCIFKAKGPAWTGYVFMVWGKTIGASFISDKERHYGETAIKAIEKEQGKAGAAIYFLEGGATYVEITPSVQVSESRMVDKLVELPVPTEEKEGQKVPAIVKEPVPEKPPVKTAEVTREPVKEKPTVKAPEKVKEPVPEKPPVKTAEKPREPVKEKPPVEIMLPPVTRTVPVEKITVKPETAPAVQPQPRLAVQAQVELKIETAEHVDLLHPSKQRVMEALEERNIVWVDEATLDALGVREQDKAIIVLPDGRSNVITLSKVDVHPGKENVIILPKKLLRRWAVLPGNTVYIQA